MTEKQTNSQLTSHHKAVSNQSVHEHCHTLTASQSLVFFSSQLCVLCVCQCIKGDNVHFICDKEMCTCLLLRSLQFITIRPHCIPQSAKMRPVATDAAWSVCVCLLVYKNSWTNRDAVWVVDLSVIKNNVLGGGTDPPRGMATLGVVPLLNKTYYTV